jgi:hypothetical protein
MATHMTASCQTGAGCCGSRPPKQSHSAVNQWIAAARATELDLHGSSIELRRIRGHSYLAI